ncbi:unnamed protein product [Effrenium voratum]|nr:unnamed protein product [Effrenium voratum]
MGAAADKCCASERDRGRQAQADASRRVRFDGEDATMTSLEKVQVLRRASRTDRPSGSESAPRAPEAVQKSAEPQVEEASAQAQGAKQKGARLLKAGIKTGEVSKLVDAKEAEEAAKNNNTASAEDENLYEF